MTQKCDVYPTGPELTSTERRLAPPTLAAVPRLADPPTREPPLSEPAVSSFSSETLETLENTGKIPLSMV